MAAWLQMYQKCFVSTFTKLNECVSLKIILGQAVLSRKCYQANKGRSSSSHDVYNQDPVLLTVKALSYIPSKIFWEVGHQTTYAYIENKHFFTKSCHHQTYVPKLLTTSSKCAKFVCTFKVIFRHEKSTESFLIFFLRRIFD